MSKNRSSISKAQSYKEIGEFWNTHDLADIGKDSGICQKARYIARYTFKFVVAGEIAGTAILRNTSQKKNINY